MRARALATAIAAGCLLAGCFGEGEADADYAVVSTDTSEICCGGACCFIDGACRTTGQINPANQCESCNPAVSQLNWTTRSCMQNGLFCDGPEECNPSNGMCESTGTPVGLDDGVACTVDGCDETNDVVTHTPDDSACDDGVFCTGVETCDVVLDCQTSPPVGLDDGIACTVDACIEASQSFTHTPNDAVCDDSAFCNGDETCNATTGCQPGTPPALGDGVGCTDDTCDEVNDVVVHTANDANCDDGAFCNGAETCDAITDCQAGTPPVLSDGVACTDDSCDEVNNVVVNAPNNANCDDGAFCNGAETCNAATDCQPGTPPTVSDGVGCTIDACDEVNDVVTHMADDSACDDGMVCTSDTCDLINDCQNDVIPMCGPDAGVDDASVPDAAVDDASVDDASVDDASVDDAAVDDAAIAALDATGQDAMGPTDEDGGCGCRSNDGGAGTLVLALFVLGLLGRRRLTAVVLGVVLLTAGCTNEPATGAVDAGAVTATTQLSLTCDKAYTQTIFYHSGARMVQTHWYAELDIEGFDPMNVRSVNTLMCEYEQLGPALGECPADAECTGKVPPANYQCQIYDHAELSPGKIRVFCGTKQEYTPPGQASNDNTAVSGFRWGRAHLRIEPLR